MAKLVIILGLVLGACMPAIPPSFLAPANPFTGGSAPGYTPVVAGVADYRAVDPKDWRELNREVGSAGPGEDSAAAANRLAERAVNARSEAREAYLRYRGNYDLARHYQSKLLPLRQTIQEQSLLQYSGMLIDVTTLIIDARPRILSNIQAIEARRDFWIVATDLEAALVGSGFGGGEANEGSASVRAATPD